MLTFLSDPNAQVRRVALSNIVGFSAKDSPHRSLLISKHKNRDGSPLIGRDGKEVDTVEDLKRLCQDQPVRSHQYCSDLASPELHRATSCFALGILTRQLLPLRMI